jgi:hypothetical protein
VAANLESSSDDDDWVVLESEEVAYIPWRASKSIDYAYYVCPVCKIY